MKDPGNEVAPEEAEETGDGWLGWQMFKCSNARSKDGCEFWEKICEPKGENKPSPYRE